jgi:hypothetical protein
LLGSSWQSPLFAIFIRNCLKKRITGSEGHDPYYAKAAAFLYWSQWQDDLLVYLIQDLSQCCIDCRQAAEDSFISSQRPDGGAPEIISGRQQEE